jgi:hypothetical protein
MSVLPFFLDRPHPCLILMRTSISLSASRRMLARLFGDQPLLSGRGEIGASTEIGHDDLAIVVGC